MSAGTQSSQGIDRRAGFTGNRPSNRPTPPPARPAGPPPPSLSEKAQQAEASAHKLFEQNAVLFAKATDTTPALIHPSEADELRRKYSLASARLDALTKLKDWRLDYYLQEKSGQEPFSPLTPEQIADAKSFFAKHGARLAGEPRQAPPNPIREREEQAKAAAQPVKPERAAGATPAAPPAAQASTPSPAPASPRETPAPAAPPPAEVRGITPPPPARLDVRFLSSEGFECLLQLVAPTGVQVLEAGAAARKKLVEQGAKPVPPAPTAEVHLHQPAAPAGAAAGAGADDEEAPMCAIHKTPMKKRKGQNGSFWSCPQKLDDGSWCPYKPPK
ncbi:MAG: hypothetical protein IT318_24880 [Anaerolineales bacterium]|nr:hypothetical protein [Anaerolineales bacterium]